MNEANNLFVKIKVNVNVNQSINVLSKTGYFWILPVFYATLPAEKRQRN